MHDVHTGSNPTIGRRTHWKKFDEFPPEIISAIASNLKPEDLISLSLTCHYVHAALLDNSSLWSTIDYTKPSQASNFLRRARKASLYVTLPTRSDSEKFTNEQRTLLLGYAKRIKTLVVGDYNPLQKAVFLAATSVETLQLDTNATNWRPETVDQYFPFLKSLTIRGSPSVHLRATPHLTQFTFDGMFLNAEAVNLFLDFLSGCPRLEELAVTHGEITQVDRQTKVGLMNLHAYTDHTRDSYDLTLYNLLQFPGKEKCSVMFTCTEVGEEWIFGFQIPPLKGKPGRIRLKTTHVSCRSGSRGEMVEYVDCVLETIDSATGNQFLSTVRETQKASGVPRVNQYYLPAINSLDTTNTETLCIEDYAGSDPAVDLLRCFPGLKKLILCCSAVMGYMNVLSPPGNRSSELVCPHLESLVIYDRYNEGVNIPGVLRTLQRVVQERTAHRRPFKLVYLPPPKSQGGGARNAVVPIGEFKGGNFEVGVSGDEMDWNSDKYFLEGLHLPNRRV